MLAWFILWRTLAGFDDATFGYVFHCFKRFLGARVTNVWSCFFCCQMHRVVTFFSGKFYHARMHSDDFMTPMQSLWLEFYWKFKVLTEIWNQCQWTNYQTIKHSSEVSQTSNKPKQYSKSNFGTIVCWSKYILSNFLFSTNNTMYWLQNNAMQWYQKY